MNLVDDNKIRLTLRVVGTVLGLVVGWGANLLWFAFTGNVLGWGDSASAWYFNVQKTVQTTITIAAILLTIVVLQWLFNRRKERINSMGIKTKTDSSKSTVPPHEIYRTHMLELKLRLQRAEFVLRSPSPVTGLASLDAEFCFLQIRRIIEIITFSAALRDEARYKKLRELQKVENKRGHGDYAKDWEAAEILKRLNEISPYFLPRPIKQIVKTEIGHHVDKKSLSVTHGRLIEIYKQSSGYLHAKNPLGKDFQTLVSAERTKYEEARKEIQKSLQFIRSIIWHHAAIGLSWSEELDPREAANPLKAWIVDFGQEDRSEIMFVLAESK